jgi:hypothetical protein
MSPSKIFQLAEEVAIARDIELPQKLAKIKGIQIGLAFVIGFITKL